MGPLTAELVQLLAHQSADRPLILTRNALVEMLQKAVGGEIDWADLTDWARFVERDDRVAYETGFEKAIAEVIFNLATPEINRPLDEAVCRSLLQELQEFSVSSGGSS